VSSGRIEVHPAEIEAIALEQRARVVRVGLVVQAARGERVLALVAAHLLERWQQQHAPIAHVLGRSGGERLRFGLGHGDGGAAQVADALDRFARLEALRQLPDRPLAHAEDEQVGLAVEQDRAPHRVRPVVVVGDAAQRGLDAAEDDGHVAVGFARAVGVDDGGAIGAHAAPAAGRILVLAAVLLLRRQAVEHRVHVAGRDAEEEARFAETAEVVDGAPVGLRDDADLEAAPLEEAGDERRAEGGMVDVGVAADDDDVELGPAARLEVLPRGGQERVLEAGAAKFQELRHRLLEM
jgi:hypothetical protein